MQETTLAFRRLQRFLHQRRCTSICRSRCVTVQEGKRQYLILGRKLPYLEREKNSRLYARTTPPGIYPFKLPRTAVKQKKKVLLK